MIFLGVNLDIAVIKMKRLFFLQHKCPEVLTSTAKEIVWRYHAINTCTISTAIGCKTLIQTIYVNQYNRWVIRTTESRPPFNF